MPLYHYNCGSCGHRDKDVFTTYEDRHKQNCSKCGRPSEMQFPAPKTHSFRGGWFEHIAEDPVYIETPMQLRDACRANDGVSVYLEDSPFKRRLGTREI